MSIKKGRVAIITGAAMGIGKGVALRFCEEGANVVLADINEELLKAYAEELTAKGYPVIYEVGDLSKKEVCERVAKAAADKWGTVDILFNCAGIHDDAMIHKMSEDQWNRVINIDLTGPFYMTQAVYPYMRAQAYGRIINVSSDSYHGNIGQVNYAAAKSGMIGMSNTMALEFAKYNITVNVVCPGTIETEALHTIPEKVFARLINAIPLKRGGTIREDFAP